VSRRTAAVACAGGLALAAATPPAWWPGAEFAVVLGLAVWYAQASSRTTPSWAGYLLGCVHMACFSWSVRHVLWPAYVAIVLVGGGYYLFGTLVQRRLAAARPPSGGGVALPICTFAAVVAATAWLRAEMPEICYPHGQACHALWQWPWLLAPLRCGGEALGNALLGALAAALVEGWRSWRTAAQPIRQVGTALVVVLALWGGLAVAAAPRLPTSERFVRVGIVEPGLHPFDDYAAPDRTSYERQLRRLLRERFVAPTGALLTRPDAPELVLWPESSLPGAVLAEELAGRSRRLDFGLPAGTWRLLVGTTLERGAGDRDGPRRTGTSTPIGVLVGPDGLVDGWHEKQRLVPGGEFLPFVAWLPAAVRDWVHGAFAAALGSAPDCVPGRWRAPLRLPTGVPIGVLTCYDNAFPTPGQRQVSAGAQLLCVLSNEAWYRGGAELDQLVAMTVCRALELRVPVVRSTMDGWSVVVGADGRLSAAASRQSAPQPGPQTLVADVPVPAAADAGPVWCRQAAGPLCVGWVVLVLLLAGRRRPATGR
jgi:apolipoprotein N-acyltransferase